MSLRGLSILAVLLVAVSLVVWKVDRPEPAPEASAQTVGSLLPAGLDAVRALEITRAGETLRVERSGDSGWTLVGPIRAEADPREVESLFRAARDAKIRRVVEDKPADRAPFGLAPPAATLRVERMDGSGTVALDIGRESPMGGSRYASAPDGRVLLVEGLDSGVSDRNADSMRERRLIPVAEGDISRITLERPAGALELVREGGDWRLKAPVEDVADTATTDGLARTIAGLQLSKVAVAPAAAPGAPEITLRVTAKDGRTLAAQLGPEVPGGTRWARREGAAAGVVEPGSLSDLTRDPSEFRDHRVMRAENDTVLSIRIVDGARALRASRKEGDSSWSVQEEPAGPVLPASASKVNELLDRLRWLRADRFDGPEPTAGARVVELEGAQGPLGRIEIDRDPYDASKLLRVRSSWRPGVPLSVPAERVGALPHSAAELTEAPSAAGIATPTSTP